MQIGIVASDGIVLASDIWTHSDVTPKMRAESLAAPVWKGEPVSKIAVSNDGCLAVARAHDLQQAKLMSAAVLSNLSVENRQNPEQRLKEIAIESLSSQFYRGSTCLVASISAPLRIFRVRCFYDPDVCKNVCECDQSNEYLLSGDSYSPATFWATRYLPSNSTKQLTVDEATSLAIQIIVDAGIINSGSIRGVEIVRGNSDGFYYCSSDVTRGWAEEARKRSVDFGERVLTPFL